MQEEKNRIERVLGATLSPELIQKVLTFALSVSYSENCFLEGIVTHQSAQVSLIQYPLHLL